MKKLIAILLALVLAAGCVACGNTGLKDKLSSSLNASGDSTGSTGETEGTEPVEKTGIYLIDSYTADADTAAAKRNDVVATLGTAELTNGLLQVYYWSEVYNFLSQYGSYAAYMGLDYTKPLDEQVCDELGTWQHSFLESALNSWRTYQSMAEAAKEAGFVMPAEMQEEMDKLEEYTLESAKEMGYDTVDALLTDQMGPGVTFEDYYNYQYIYLYSYGYFEQLYKELNFTQADIEAYFTENEASLKESGVTKDSGLAYSVRHILLFPEGGTTDSTSGTTTYTEAEYEACRVKAQALLDQWLSGEATEDSFAALANEHSVDGGSNANGGLYDGLNEETNFVPEFKEWYLDESRQVGDYGLVKSDSGYHIMYFSGAEEAWIYTCREALLDDASSKFISDAVEQYEMELDHEKIVLGEVDLSEDEE